MALILTFLFIGVGLAMDAFAVSICKGLAMRKVNPKQALIIALVFGGFQALMPSLGYLLGSQFAQYITRIDHWIAFLLLAFIGGKMLMDALRPTDAQEEVPLDAPLDWKELLLMAVATSIDALAVGITFAFLDYPLALAVGIIGVTTFVICIAGVYIGNYFGTRYQKKAQLLGGVILIAIGAKILLEHLGVLG